MAFLGFNYDPRWRPLFCALSGRYRMRLDLQYHEIIMSNRHQNTTRTAYWLAMAYSATAAVMSVLVFILGAHCSSIYVYHSGACTAFPTPDEEYVDSFI